VWFSAQAMLSSAHHYRRNKGAFSDELEENQEFLPWTVGTGRMNIRNIVVQQVYICFLFV